MKKHFYQSIFYLSVFVLLLAGCKKKEKDTPSYQIPTTYNFLNVNYSDQTTRLAMFTEIETEFNKGKTQGVVVDAQKLKDMFANRNSQFVSVTLNASTLQLKDQNTSLAQTDIERYMDSLGVASQSNAVASNGIAGVGVGTTDQTKKYLLSANGINYGQLITKSLMGSLICYQIVNNYLSTGIANGIDNATVVTGQGTAMEHNWDQAFGYFDVPIDFPTNKTGIKYFGSYCSQVDSGLHSNSTFMNAFLKGRAAISNKDMTTKDAQAAIIIGEFEKMTAAAAIHELNEVKEDLTNTPKVNTNLSESMGFVLSLRYNPKKTIITDDQINTILGYYGTNFYNITLTDINKIQDAISAIYGFDAVKSYM